VSAIPTGLSGREFRHVLHDAAVIVAVATVFGFGYTALLSKGLFAQAGKKNATPAPPVISYAEARALFDGGNALFVDARPPFDFGLGHIKGAFNLPLKDFDASGAILELLPKDQLLVTYCDGEDCNSSVLLAAKLDSAGYKHVKVFFGGWKEWTARHLPVE
jgi:rhodanese-related sulfurtransferase